MGGGEGRRVKWEESWLGLLWKMDDLGERVDGGGEMKWKESEVGGDLGEREWGERMYENVFRGHVRVGVSKCIETKRCVREDERKGV